MNVTQRIAMLEKRGEFKTADILKSKPRCELCGAIISENNPDGYGYSCREKLEEAVSLSFKNSQNWEEKNPFFDISVKAHIEWTESYLQEHKLRNEFYKSFIPSVLEQYKTKGYLSKKQKEILFRFVELKISGYMYDNGEYEAFKKVIGKAQREWMNVYWRTAHFTEIRELALKLIFASKGKTDLSDEIEEE